MEQKELNHLTEPPTHAQNMTVLVMVLVLLIAAGIGAYFLRKHSTEAATSGTSMGGMPAMTGTESSGLTQRTVKGVTVTFSQKSLHNGQNDFVIEFKNANGDYVDAGKVNFNLAMNMPGMEMSADSSVTPSGKPGRYEVKTKPAMSGDWQAKLSFQSPQGKVETTFPVPVQ